MADVNILLVEDESIEALDIKHTLESFGYKVPYIASGGEDAVEKVLDIMPDLVLIDIVLKGNFNGIKVASEVKKLKIPFIYLTAHSEEATVQEAKLTEPYGFIIKPYDPLELKYTIDIALYKKSVEKVRDDAEKLRRKTENDLKLASLYNRSLIEASLDPLVTIGPDGKITDVNQATATITGYSRKELIGTDFSDYFTEPNKARKGYQKVFKEGFVRDYPLNIQKKDKNVTPVLYNASVYKDESGDVVGVFAAARDITQLKKVENQLKKSTLYNRNLIEASLDPLVTIGPDGKITDVNQATEMATGYSRSELIGTDFSQYFTTPEKAKEGYQQVFKEGYVRDYLLEIQHKNGNITPVLYNASLYKDGSNSVAGVFAAARDITQRQKADEKIHEIMENFRAMTDNASEGIIIETEEGTHVYANQMAAEITGYSAEELLNTSISDLTHPSKIKGLMKRYNGRTLNEPLFPTHETLIVRKDKKVIPVEFTGAKTVWKGQSADMIIIRDISERKQAEKEQKHLNRKLKAISNCNQTLLRAVDEPTLLKEICRIICDEAGYRLAWVGYAKHDKNKTIHPVAWAGFDSGYISNTKLTWSEDTAKGLGPAGIVIRGGEIVYVQDFTTDPLMAPWRESALNHGYRSGIALPLKDKKKNVFGVLMIYSSEANAITADEIWLMEELAGNLAFGITSLREQAELKQVKEELKLASLYNRSLIEASLDPLVTIGPDGKITDVNQATEKVTGYSREKIIGTDFSDYFTEPDKAKEGYQKVFKEGFVRDYPLKIQHQTGYITPVLYNASVYKDESGNVTGVFAAARDITERQKSEEKIQMLANMVESSDDAIISKSLDGRITSWNKGAELIYGYSSEEVMGKDISILTHSKLKEELNQFIEKIKQGEHILHYETVRVPKDGAEINVSLTLSPIFDTSGDLTGISTIARDITQRKKNDDAILRVKEEWEHTFDSVPDLITILDANFKVVRANKAMANRLGVDPEEAVGLTCYKAVHGLDLPPSFCPHMKLLEDGHEHTAEVHEDLLGGDFIVSVSPLHDSEGKLTGSVHVARDITDRKKAENKIKKSLKEKEVLLSEIHHRVKNNMQIISSLLNLQSQYVVNAETIDVLQESQDRVKAMATIYEKLAQSNDLTKINFKSYIQSIIQGLFYSHKLKEGQITPIIKIENIMLNIETAIPCGLIISELVSNSLKHAFPEGKKGKLCVWLKTYDNKYELKIGDNGIGFPEEIDFKKTDTLGLKLVTNLVNQIDGEITLNKDHCTEFKIIFKELKYKKRI